MAQNGSGEDIRRAFFTDLWEKHPDGGPQAVGWGSEESQEARFLLLAGVGRIRNSSILDVGCGTGQFVRYLWNQEIRLRSYLGIDMMKKSIEEAWKIHAADAEHAAEEVSFYCADFLEGMWGHFDYVIASGIFSIRTDDWHEHTKAVLEKMFDVTDRAVAVNFLSSMHEDQVPESMYVHPGNVLDMALKITPKVTLIHGYRPNDFTVYLNR